AHRPAVGRVEGRRIFVNELGSLHRSRQIGGVERIEPLPQTGELLPPDWRNLRKESDGGRKRSVDNARLRRLGRRHRQRFDVAVNDDAPDAAQLLTGGRKRRKAPGENYFGTALCYNEV